MSVGEGICGEWLRHVKGCEFVQYNLETTEVQGEIDVIGINLAELYRLCLRSRAAPRHRPPVQYEQPAGIGPLGEIKGSSPMGATHWAKRPNSPPAAAEKSIVCTGTAVATSSSGPGAGTTTARTARPSSAREKRPSMRGIGGWLSVIK